MKVFTISIIIICIVFLSFGCHRDHSSEPQTLNFDELTWQLTSIDSQSVMMLAAGLDAKVFVDIGDRKLYFSNDLGLSWQTSPTNYNIINMAFRPNGEIYALTNCMYTGQILRSYDSGLSWQNIKDPSNPITCPQSIVFHPSGSIFIGNYSDESASIGGIYKSMGDFNTLENTTFPDSLGVFCMTINSKNNMFSGTMGGVYRSLDIGETWIEVNDGLVDTEKQPRWNYVYHLINNPVNDYIFAATSLDIFKSKDNGNTWSNTGLQDVQYISDIAINKDGVLFAVAWSGTPQNGVYYSLDNGDTWLKLDKDMSLPVLFSITIDSNGYLYAGTRNGLFRTNKSTTN